MRTSELDELAQFLAAPSPGEGSSSPGRGRMTVNPRTEFHHFPHNTRLYAEYWLKTGTRLDGWASRVDPELREEVLAELEGVAG